MTTKASNKAELKKESKSLSEYLQEKVPFRAFYDGEKYKDDIIVNVNGKRHQIRRGVVVHIPRYVYNALEDSERQKAVAADVSLGFERAYKQVEDKLKE